MSLSVACLLLVGWLLAPLAAPAQSEMAEEPAEVLVPGPARERPIAGGEAHVYRVEVGEEPVLISVEQRGIDLVIEAQGPTARQATDTGDFRWGAETLLLESAGEHQVKVRAKERFVTQGRYTIASEVLSSSSPEARRTALSLVSRAGQEAFLQDPEARRRALASYREALAAWRSLGERRGEADALFAIASLEYSLSELQPAAVDYSRVLALWQELGEPQLEAATLNWLGLVRLRAGDLKGAREALEAALALRQGLGGRFDEAVTRSNLCLVEQTSDELPEALACYEDTLALFRELGCKKDEARILNNLGGVYDGRGEPDAALEYYEQALALRRVVADRRGEAETLNNLATVHRALGDWQGALRLYDQVREILATVGDRTVKGTMLSNLGFAYNSLGEPQRARSLLEEALKLRRETGDRRGEVITLNNLGTTWRNLGDPAKAIDYHRRALELATTLGDQRQQAISQLRLGEVHLDQRDSAAALREIGPALDTFRATGNRRNEVEAMDLRGHALGLAGQLREAAQEFQAALSLHRSLRDRAGEAEALRALAATERSLGRFDDARTHVGEAMARVEELRTGFVTPALRAAFLATQRRTYSLAIDLLMDRHVAKPAEGRDREAFAVSEQARARILLDVLLSGSTGHAETAVPAGPLERRQSLRRRLSAKADQQLKQSGAKAEALGREIETLLAELDTVEGEARRLDPRYAAVAAPPAFRLEDVAGLLDSGTLLLEYSLGEERSYLWVVGTDSFRSFVLPAEREIEALVRRRYGELSTIEAGAGLQTATAVALSRMLLGEVWPHVERCRRLVVVPDAALHIVPFGALLSPSSGEFLLDQLEITYLPSATTLALQRQRLERRIPASRWAAVFADAVFTADDPRLKDPSLASQPAAGKDPLRGVPEEAPLSALERLPATRREAEAIISLAPDGQVSTWLDAKANREAVLSGGLRGFRVVHLATHGLADTRRPELSGLVFSLVDSAGQPREGLLTLSDIYELDLDADLVVLSGCRTALGKEVRGEGVMGLTRGFLYAGVPRVVASLWRVQDRTTAELMARFYKALWGDGLSPAAALRATPAWGTWLSPTSGEIPRPIATLSN